MVVITWSWGETIDQIIIFSNLNTSWILTNRNTNYILNRYE